MAAPPVNFPDFTKPGQPRLTIFDLFVFLFCFGLCFGIYILRSRSSYSRSRPILRQTLPRGYLLHTSVTHTRLLPAASKHAFTYPALFVLVSLKALEAGELDLGLRWGWRWAFGYGKPKRRLMAIQQRGYLSGGREGEAKTIRERLDALLKSRGFLDTEPNTVAHDAWMLTMPSFVGWEGINPLTVYFVYSLEPGRHEDGARLAFVVLEIHNTFGESHAHVLKVGEGEDGDGVRARGYDHQWTFPREFHVSPFNDRSGYYTVSVKRPSHPPSPPPDSNSSPESSLFSTDHTYEFPKPAVRVHLYTPASTNPADTSHSSTTVPSSSAQASTSSSISDLLGELKLTAELRPTLSTPLIGSSVVLKALVQMPFELLLTMPRILYQAWILHYGKPMLDVYLRPEMFWPGWERVEHSEVEARPVNIADGKGKGREADKPASGSSIRGGGVRWLNESYLERYARWRLQRFLDKRVEEVGVKVTLVPANPAVQVRTWVPKHMLPGGRQGPDGADEGAETYNATGSSAAESSPQHLRITYLSPKFFMVLLFSPSAEHALLIGCDTEKLFNVSSRDLFVDVFIAGEQDAPAAEQAPSPTRPQRLRMRPIPISSPTRPLSREMIPIPIPTTHFLDRPSSSPSASRWTLAFLDWLLQDVLNMMVIYLCFALQSLEKWVLRLFRARIVKGQEPWLAWERSAHVYWGQVGLDEYRGDDDDVTLGSVRHEHSSKA